MSKPSELAALGLKPPPAAAHAADALIPLTNLPRVTAHLDLAAQKVLFTAPDAQLLPQLLTSATRAPAASYAVASGTGATLNYDVNSTTLGNQTVGSALLDLRAFSPWGVITNGLLAYDGGGPSSSGGLSAIRLDTVYTYSDPATLRQYRLGDFINGSLAWTRAIRLGGIQISSNFSLRPDLITFPLPSISGSAAVPSTVDLLVNGNRLLSRQVQAGPFEIPQLPVVTGAGTVSMTVTNALGLPTVVTLPFYASSSLLSPGLQTYSFQAGVVRNDWGVVSNDYGAFAASGTYRRGLTPWLTVEGTSEATTGTAMAGAGGVVNLGNIAVLNLSVAASTGSGHAVSGVSNLGGSVYQPDVTGRSGGLFSIGVQRLGRVFSIGGSATFASHNYRDIAAMNGVPFPRSQLTANAGLSLGRFGSFGIAYAKSHSDAAAAPIPVNLPLGTILAGTTVGANGTLYYQPAQNADVLSVSYSVQVSNVSFYVTAFRDSAPGGTSAVLAGVTIPLGSRSSASVSAGSSGSGPYGQIQAQQSPIAIGDFGYQAVASSANGGQHEFVQAQYESPWSMFTIGADRLQSETAYHAEAQGAVSIFDGGLFFSNTIPDSFAVVDANGLKNVKVLQENRDVGRTNGQGLLLVPNLRSFELNHIAIEATDVPQDATIDVSSHEIRPQYLSGVIVRFPVHFNHAALLRLKDAAGAVIPVGSIATLLPKGTPVPVGYEGEAYIEDLLLHNTVLVEKPLGQTCIVRFDYHRVPGQIPIIGPLTCSASPP